MKNKLDKDYLDLIRDIKQNGYKKGDRTGTGTTSVFGREIRHKMSDGFPLLTTKKMPFKTIKTELFWFLRGDTNIQYLVQNGCNIWNGDAYRNFLKHNSPHDHLETQKEFVEKIKTDDKFARKWGDLGPIYGKQWRDWTNYEYSYGNTVGNNSIDQIQNILNTLETNPDSRRMLVSAWNVGELDDMVLPPCHFGFQVYTREMTTQERNEWYFNTAYKNPQYRKDWKDFELDQQNVPKRAISLKWHQRSVDVGLGLPFNVASYGLLLEMIAQEVNMVPDELIGTFGDTHVYNNHWEGLKEQLKREPYELPTIQIQDGMYSHKDEIKLVNYKSHDKVNLPLSN